MERGTFEMGKIYKLKYRACQHFVIENYTELFSIVVAHSIILHLNERASWPKVKMLYGSRPLLRHIKSERMACVKNEYTGCRAKAIHIMALTWRIYLIFYKSGQLRCCRPYISRHNKHGPSK